MPNLPVDSAPGAQPDEANPVRTYVLVLVVEVAVIAGLYWLTRHFS